MSKKQKGLIVTIIAVIIIGFSISKSSIYIKSDVKIDSTKIKVDSAKIDTTTILEKPIVR